jgi:hypothetical protein
MNKKSAVVTAGGLAASFVAGVAAVSFHWGLGDPSVAAVSANGPAATAPHKKVKPIVKHRRIVVHKKAPAPKGPSATSGSRTVTVAPPAPTQNPPVVTTSGSHGGGGESDDGGERGDD